MHPTMRDWLTELEAEGPVATQEAQRFLEVVREGGKGSPSIAHNHAQWKARAGFDRVLAKALEITTGA